MNAEEKQSITRSDEYIKNKDFLEELRKKYLTKEYLRRKAGRYRQAHPELTKEINRRAYIKGKDGIRKRARILYWVRRLTCVYHYGGDPPACSCCGEKMLEFLSIHHINGGGTKERIIKNRVGHNLFNYLIDNDFPEGFGVLCHNCNQADGFYGYCPHKGVPSNSVFLNKFAPRKIEDLYLANLTNIESVV